MPSGISPRVAAALGVQALITCGLLAVVADQYAHKRVETFGGVNTWGYRGRVLHARQPGEIRLAYVGGSQAFGWGVASDETTAGYLRHAIENAVSRQQYDGPITIANLAALELDVSGYASRLNNFRHLQPDLVCLHLELARPVGGPVMPPRSAIATLTGYTPMLPTVLEEKAWLGASRVGVLLRRADTWIDDLMTGWPSQGEPAAAVSAAIDAALQVAGRAIVILPAPMSADQAAEHARLQAMLQPLVAADSRLRLVDMAVEPALLSPTLRIDGTNLGAGGHSLEASAILPAALDLLQFADRPITR